LEDDPAAEDRLNFKINKHMTVEDLEKICNNLKGVTRDIKWEDHLCFNVGGKMFLVTTPDHVPSSASFRVDEEEFEDVIAKPGISKHVYLGRYHWVQLDDINRLSAKQWEKFINTSYRRVAEKLPKKTQRELGLL
jgi:predicted DNA-binding protein (MmcQ/YjbR family)